MVLAGLSKEQMSARIKSTLTKKELPPLEPGSMAYMMSKQAYLSDDGAHHVAHVVFYTPLMDGAKLGCGSAQISCPPRPVVPRQP